MGLYSSFLPVIMGFFVLVFIFEGKGELVCKYANANIIQRKHIDVYVDININHVYVDINMLMFMST